MIKKILKYLYVHKDFVFGFGIGMLFGLWLGVLGYG
jgi:hypothetical protein